MSAVTVNIKSPVLGIDENMTIDGDSYKITYDNRVLIDNNFISITIDNGFLYEFSNVNCFYDIGDVLTIKSFKKEDLNYYFLNIPLIEENEFRSDFEYYMDIFVKYYTKTDIQNKRMTNDELDLRFLNTYFIPAETTKQITLQEYDFDIALPLRVKCVFVINKSTLLDKRLNLTDEIEKLKQHIAASLYENYTGTQIIFYKSKLIDLTHNIDWIKSVAFEITDYEDREIPDGNIESYSNKEVVKILSKETLIDFSPIYWHWDINNIEITYKLDDL